MVGRLGAELVRRGATAKLIDLARRYYADLKAGRPSEVEWSTEHVLHLARVYQVPPHETYYQVRPYEYRECCANHAPFVAARLPDGALLICNNCRASWLVLTGW